MGRPGHWPAQGMKKRPKSDPQQGGWGGVSKGRTSQKKFKAAATLPSVQNRRFSKTDKAIDQVCDYISGNVSVAI